MVETGMWFGKNKPLILSRNTWEVKEYNHTTEDGRDLRAPAGTERFRVCTELADFPVTADPVYIKESIGAVCRSGSAVIQVYENRCRIEPGMVVTLLPWQLVSIGEISADFRLTFFRVPLEMFTDSLSCLWRLRPSFFFYMGRHIVSEPTQGNVERFLYYCEFLDYRVRHTPENCRQESIMQLLRVYYWDIYTVYLNDPEKKKNRYSHKEELACKFVGLVVDGNFSGRDVGYYAEKLGVSPKYLTNLVKSLSGHSAREWIVHYTILEIKSLLRKSSMDLKTIALRVRFPDRPTLCRFFRRYAGMTPTQYRESIHF